MPRAIDPTLLAAISAAECWPVQLLQLQFRSQTCYAWTGVGTLSWNGNNFLGVGSVGQLGDVRESSEVRADGTSVGLSGLDNVYLGEALGDIQLGAPANRWLGAVQAGTATLIGTPYLLFSGCVDKPQIYTGADKMLITLALESRWSNHARASNARYTTNDQHSRAFPDDIALNWIEIENDLALRFGS